MEALREQGALGFTDDGHPVADAGVLREALQCQRKWGGTIALHEEDRSLSRGGAMHEGALSAELGIPGIPCASEASMVARDAVLAGSEGARVHFQHLSCVASVQAVAAAKARGVGVSAEATPHHLLLTEEAVRGIREGVGGVGVDEGGVKGGSRSWSGHTRKDEPPACHRGRSQGAGRGAASGHDRLRRHRSRAARAGGEGAGVHRGPDGDDRVGDGVRRALHGAGAAGRAGPGGAARTDDRRRRAVRTPRPDDRAGRGGQYRADRSRCRMGGRRARLAEPLGELLLRREAPAREGAADGGRRRGGIPSSGGRRRCAHTAHWPGWWP